MRTHTKSDNLRELYHGYSLTNSFNLMNSGEALSLTIIRMGRLIATKSCNGIMIILKTMNFEKCLNYFL